MRIIYTVPKCPKCESKRTGRYIEYHGLDPDGYQASFLKKGEIVIPSYTTHVNNLFCVDCEFEWNGAVNKKFISRKELNKLKEEIGISSELIDELEDHIVESILKHREANRFKAFKIIGKYAKKLFTRATIEPIMDILPVKPDVKDDFDEMLADIMGRTVQDSSKDTPESDIKVEGNQE